ncbi:MAG: hypothetical protein Q6370_020530 [Candidatus Sigynarchaeota archaeon]
MTRSKYTLEDKTMQIITRVLGHSAREIVNPRRYLPDADATRDSAFECQTRYKCCECMFVERDARLYPCSECVDNMLVQVPSPVSRFIPRDVDAEDGELETLLFTNDDG